MDPHAPPFEELLRQASWLRRLARELCADPGAADDLVQGACVAAAARPPRAAAALRSWLRRVLRNLGRERARVEHARSRREQQVARPEAQASAADIVARAETGRRLAACVLELPEPYRSTVLLRYFDDRSCAAIAQEHGVPDSTVRNRLARGLLLLRERLQRQGGREWLTSALLLAGPGAAPAGVAAGAPLGLSPAAWTLIGTMTMSTLAKTCVGVVLVAALALAVWPVAETPAAALPEAEARAPAARELVAPGTEVPRVALTPPAQSMPVDQPAPTPPAAPEPSLAEIEALMTEVGPGILEGVLLRGRTRVANATVRCRQGWDPLPAQPLADVLVARTDEQGGFRFAGLRSERYRIGADDPLGTHAETLVQILAEQPSRRVVLVLGSARIEGRVYDAQGQPAVGAWVNASLDTTRLKVRMGFDTGRRTDARGAFVLGELPAGTYWLWARLDGDNRSGVQPDSMEMLPALQVGETRVIDIGDPRPATVWTGTVRARNGEPVAGPATLGLTETSRGTYHEAQYDAHGRFRVALRPGTWQGALGTRSQWNERVRLDPVTVGAADFERDLTLPGVRISGVLIDQGTGLAWSRQRPMVEVSIHREGHDYPAAFQRLDATADGRFVFDGLAAGTWLLSTRFVGVRNNARHEVPGTNVTGFRVHVLATDLELPVRVVVAPP